MPMTYSLDQINRLVRARAWGSLSNEDLHGYYHGLAADPLFDAGFRELLDLRSVIHFVLDSSLIREVASWTAFRSGTRRAFVAASDVAFGLSRMFSTYADSFGHLVAVFRDAREAEDWLEAFDGVSPRVPPACAA